MCIRDSATPNPSPTTSLVKADCLSAMEQSVVQERRETSCGLVRFGPRRKECVPRDGSRRLSYCRQERPAALAVGAVPGLGGAYGSGQGRLARVTPGAEVADRTVPAARGACRTDQRAELHRGDRPAGRIRALRHVRLLSLIHISEPT